MIAGRESVAFLAVAPAIRKHEVVVQIHRITSPRDEVIDVGRRWHKRCATVEASARWISSRTGRTTAKAARSLPKRNSLRSAVSPSISRFCWRTNRPHAPRTRSEISGWNLRKQNATPGRSVMVLPAPFVHRTL